MTAGNKLLLSQGPHGPWKIWKVMEFKNCIFQVWKVTEFNCQSVKVMENLTFFGRLVTADDKARAIQDREK